MTPSFFVLLISRVVVRVRSCLKALKQATKSTPCIGEHKKVVMTNICGSRGSTNFLSLPLFSLLRLKAVDVYTVIFRVLTIRVHILHIYLVGLYLSIKNDQQWHKMVNDRPY